MTTFQILCTGPGPHNPANGVLGTSSVPPTGDIRCGSTACFPAESAALVNRDTVMAAIAQTIIDMQAILDTATIPAGTLSTAQLSSFVRAAQTQINSVALRVKQMARLLNGDFTSST